MDEKTRGALERSIEHWTRRTRGHSDTDCALCGLFNNKQYHCRGCPVFERTGQTGCDGTPYWDWVSAATAPQRRKAAKRELDFLISLRDPEQPK